MTKSTESAEVPPRLWVLITWDDGTPLVRTYEDDAEAAETYRDATIYRDHAYLYVTNESGHMDLILEYERIPGGRH